MVKTAEDKEFEKYLKELNKFIFNQKLFDDEDKDAKFEIEVILYLADVYLPKCLISTIIDVDNFWEKFDASYEVKDRKTQEDYNKYSDELENYIVNVWKENGSVIDEEETRLNIKSFTMLLCNYGCVGTISRITQIMELTDEFDNKKELLELNHEKSIIEYINGKHNNNN